MGPARVVWNGIRGMAGTPLALERSYGCLNCDFWDYGDGLWASFQF